MKAMTRLVWTGLATVAGWFGHGFTRRRRSNVTQNWRLAYGA